MRWNPWAKANPSDDGAITALIADIEQNGFKADAMGQAMDIALSRPERVGDLVRAVISELPKGGIYLDAVMSYMPVQEYPAVVEHALKALATNRDNKAAVSVIQYGFLQCRAAVEPHRERIVRLGVSLDRFGETGAAGRGGAAQPDSPVFHFIFEDGYLSHPQPSIASHPTWHLSTSPDVPTIPFGGLLADRQFGSDAKCAACGGPLHHLLTLGPVPEGLGVSAMDRVMFASCLSCVGWEVEKLYYAYNATGVPENIGYSGAHVTPQFPARPLAPTTVRLATTPSRWRRQDSGLSNSRENLFRIGGFPTWVQNNDYARCPRCSRAMTSLLQLDSSIPLVERTATDGSEEVCEWGDGGIAYVQWCDGCKVSAVFWQCT